MAVRNPAPPAPSVATKRLPGQREDIEAWLDEKAVQWSFLPKVDIKKFDLERSLKNQARISQVLDQSQVEVYIEAMKRGDVFPGVIAYVKGDKYIAIDGNHRLHAALVTTEKLPVYLLDAKTDPNTIVLLTFEANAKHGLPNSVDERLRHAITMIESTGASHEMAASRLNLSKGSVARAWNKHRADRRADEAGLKAGQWDTLVPAVKQRLSSLRTDEGFVIVADLAYRARLTSEEVDEVVVDVNKSRSGVGQREIATTYVDRYRIRIQGSGGGVARPSRVMGAKRNLQISFGHLTSTYDKAEQFIASVHDSENEDLQEKCEEAIVQLQSLIELLVAKVVKKS